jgi:FdhD protein
MAEQGILQVAVEKSLGAAWQSQLDCVAIEEPLEIRLGYGPAGQRAVRSISITMRTPGDDAALAVGFLVSEGIVAQPGQIALVRACGPEVGTLKLHNTIRVELAEDVAVDLQRLERHFYTTSSCGVCGKTSLAALAIGSAPALCEDRPRISRSALHSLPSRLRQAQEVFERTGGLHAAALFDAQGNIHGLREDVGRHNAVDKVIGGEFLVGRLPLLDCGLLVSGRASFELMQKALLAGIPMLAAIGAPSSLAVELAQQFKMTLIGFLRDDRFNVYSGIGRVH